MTLKLLIRSTVSKVRAKKLAKRAAQKPQRSEEERNWAIIEIGGVKKVYPVEYEYYLQLMIRQGLRFHSQETFQEACLHLSTRMEEAMKNVVVPYMVLRRQRDASTGKKESVMFLNPG